MNQGIEQYLLYTQLAEHERIVAAHRQEHQALGLRPQRRRVQLRFGWALRLGRAVRLGSRAPVSGA